MQCLRDSFQIQLFMQMAFDIVNCRYNIFDISWHCSFLLSRQIIAENFIPFFMYLAVFIIYKPQKIFNIPLYKFRMPADCIGYIFLFFTRWHETTIFWGGVESKKRAIEQPFFLVIIYPFIFYRFSHIQTRKLCILSRKPLYYHENSQPVSVIIQTVSVFV